MVTFVRAPRERVYDALTQAEHLDAWFTTGAEIDPRPGREMRWRWVNWGPDQVTTEDWVPVVEARRSERYVFQSQAALGGTTVKVDFDEHPKGTVSRAHASTDIQTRPRAGPGSWTAYPSGARRWRCSSSTSSTASATDG